MSIKIINKLEAIELYGRMLECAEISNAIKNGQFKTLEDLKKAIDLRSEIINKSLKEFGVFKGNREVKKEEFDLISASYESSLPTTIKH